MIHSRIKWSHTDEDTKTKQKTIRSQNTLSEKDCRDLTKINRQRKHEGFDRSLPKCVKIIRKGNDVVSRRKERARQFYEVGCLQVKLEQEGEESWEVSAKKVAEGSDASRKYVARCGRSLRLRLLLGSGTSVLEAARLFLKTRQTRYVDGQSSEWWQTRKTLRPRWAKWTQVLFRK